jgi:hypothetical protein
VGIGFGRFEQLMRHRAGWLGPLTASVLAITMTLNSFDLLIHQTIPEYDSQGRPMLRPPGDLVDTIPRRADLPTQPGQFEFGDHPLNFLPPHSVTYLIGDNGSLLYIRRPVVYSSAFDASLLGELIRRHGGDVRQVTLSLRRAGITHVWANLADLQRLHQTYGYDPQVTPQNLAGLTTAGWQRIRLPSRHTVLLRLPDRVPAPPAPTPVE